MFAACFSQILNLELDNQELDDEWWEYLECFTSMYITLDESRYLYSRVPIPNQYHVTLYTTPSNSISISVLMACVAFK